MNIGQHIHKLRKQKGLSSMALAQKAGISQSTISEIERDVRSPQLNTLEKICQSLECSVMDILPIELRHLRTLKDDESLILELFEQLKEEEKHALIQFLSAVTNRSE